MDNIAVDCGWNDCLEYLISRIDEFHNTLQGGQYDYFPDDELREYYKSLERIL